jgi:type IV pilus assembly protein PilO
MASLPGLDKLQKISPKTRLIAFGAVILLIIIVYIIQFQIPMNTKNKELNSALADLRSKIQANDSKIRKLDELKAEVKNLQTRLVVLTEQLPPGSEVSGLLRQIQGLVNKSGLVLKIWKPDKPRTHSSGLYEEIPVSLSLIGGYHNTALLFDRIGKLTRIVNVSNIKLSGAKIGKSGNVEMDITCTAMTFAAVEKKIETPPQAAKKVQ